MALRHAREQGSKVLAICNTQGASIPRESDAVLYTHAGPEVAVASTKAFVAQITAVRARPVPGAGQRRHVQGRDRPNPGFPEGHAAQDPVGPRHPDQDRAGGRQADGGREVLPVPRTSCGVSGRHGRRAEAQGDRLHLHRGFAAGELKHGPIALVDEGEPVVFIVPPARGRNVLHAKVISGIEEVKARGAYIIAVAEENDPDVERYADVVFWRPACPTLMSRWWTWCRCSCSPWTWPSLRTTTWTSRATSPSQSPLSNERRHRYVLEEPHIPFEYEVLYEDENIIVIDKPHFLATTPRGMWYRETALVRLCERYDEPNITPAHRLDRLTQASSCSYVIRLREARTRCCSKIAKPSKPTNAWHRSPRRSGRDMERRCASTGTCRFRWYAGRISTRIADDCRRTKAPTCPTRKR